MSKLSSTIVATLKTQNYQCPQALFDLLKTELFKRSSEPYITSIQCILEGLATFKQKGTKMLINDKNVTWSV